MIKVVRLAKPSILVKNEALWMRAIRRAKTKKALDDAMGKYRQKSIKNQLSRMFHGKCAYCESEIEHVDYGDIEHYKPKSKFPLHAVQWENLLLACSKCNGAGQKGDAWPSKAEGGLLINPCDEEPADFFEFVFDTATRATIVRPLNDRGIKSEAVYGLNKLKLVKHRDRVVRKLVALAHFYNQSAEARACLDEATQTNHEYSAFARMVKAEFVP